MTSAPICPACGLKMSALVLDFRDPHHSRARWQCVPCGEIVQQQPKPRPIARPFPAFDDCDNHDYSEAVSW